jgi:hypothetical protein
MAGVIDGLRPFDLRGKAAVSRGGVMTVHAQRKGDLEEDNSDWEPTPAEWDEWIDRATANLGTTYEELERQYHEDDFESIMARGLWVIIGGSRPSTYGK